MKEKIKELLEYYEEKLNYHSGICEDYIKKYGDDKCDYIIYHKNRCYVFSGAIQALKSLLS